MQLGNLQQGHMWKLLLVNTLSCGLEGCLATVTVYIPPLLLQAGMEERYMTMMLAIPPVLGMILIPIISSASDSHQSHFGRRRPFIWMLSTGVFLGLQIMPHARRLAMLMSPQHHHWLEAALQGLAVCMLVFCAQACCILLMALLSDLYPGEEENSRAFSFYSMMTSLGGCLGFLLPVVDWRHIPIEKYLGGQEALVYALLTFLFLSCLLTTAFIPEETGTRGEGTESVVHKPLKIQSSRYCPHWFLTLPQNFYAALGQCASSCMSVLPRIYAAYVQFPTVLWRLFVAELCNWMALLSVMAFFADFMGEGVYQGVPNAEPESEERKQYDEGVRIGSLGLFLQCVVSRLCSMLMERWLALLGARVVYVSSAALLVLTTAVMAVSHSVITVTVMVAVTGYTQTNRSCLLSENDDPAAPTGYFCSRTEEGTLSEEDVCDGSPHVSLLAGGNERDEARCTTDSQRGICYDMAIVGSAYLISQVLPALCLGSLVQLANSVRAYMAFACCFSALAFLCSTRIIYSRADLQH